MGMVGEVVAHAVHGLLKLAENGKLHPAKIDWLAVHYSSHLFRDQSYELAAKAGFNFPRERWFTNLYTTGNVGSASIFLLLEELRTSGELESGQNVLCLVPESGRFLFGYMLLKVVEGLTDPHPVSKPAINPATRDEAVIPRTEPPNLRVNGDPLAQELIRSLARVGFDFAERLQRGPIVAKLYYVPVRTEDYIQLLFNCRNQAIHCSRR